MKVNWFTKKDSDCVITLSKEDFKDGEFNLNLKLKDYKREVKKGDLIKFDLGSKMINPNSQFANEYRVLKVDENNVYVVSMYELARMDFGDSQEYFGNYIDRYLEYGFYNSLSEKVKDAIKVMTINQSFFKTMGGLLYESVYASNAETKASNCTFCQDRHIAILDYYDILNYFGYNFSTRDIYETFFKKAKYGSGHSFWLRSADSSYSSYCWRVRGGTGYVDNYNYNSGNGGVRPAFTIDLSKIDWEFVDEN